LPKCRNCGKEVSEDRTFCNEECTRHFYKAKLDEPFKTQFDKGFGSIRRETNIQRVVEMLESGISEDEIRTRLQLYFKSATINEYLEIAKNLLKLKTKSKPSEGS